MVFREGFMTELQKASRVPKCYQQINRKKKFGVGLNPEDQHWSLPVEHVIYLHIKYVYIDLHVW